MSESYFAKLANDILDASEKLTVRLEEGLSVLWKEMEGSSPSSASRGGGSTQQQDTASENEFEGWDEAEMGDPSPLQGIAESVMGDIMASQVSSAMSRRHRENVLWAFNCDSCTVVMSYLLYDMLCLVLFRFVLIERATNIL